MEKKNLNLVEVQENLELLFNKNQTNKRIYDYFKVDFKDTFDFEEYFKANDIPEHFGFTLLVQMYLHKRAMPEVMVGVLRSIAGTAQTAAHLLEKSIALGLVGYDPNSQQLIVLWQIPHEIQREIDLYQYPLPMLVKPKFIDSNRTSGYLKTKRDSIILKNNHHDLDVRLDSINKLNRTPLRINRDTAFMIANSWRDLDKPKQGESKEEYKRRLRAFEKYDQDAKNVLNILDQANDQFYMTHKYDKRGRIYCQGYHVNYQGNDWNKAVVEFSNKEVVV